MILTDLQLFNFRNYQNQKISFDPHLNIFIGKNGAGKTNILESIYFLALARSYRSSLDTILIRETSTNMKVTGFIKNKNKHLKDTYEISLNTDNLKKVAINNNYMRKLSNYISNINVVLFSPESINIIKGSPSERRKYINITISQINNKYLTVLNEFNQLLKIRNNLLKQASVTKIDETYFEIITDKIISREIILYHERLKFINILNSILAKTYYNLSKINHLKIKYVSTVGVEENDSFETIKEKLFNKYHNNLKKEIILGSTHYGIHRDDFIFDIDGQNLLDFGSQGQQRLAVLALKLCEEKIIKQYTGEYPIILLDDVFSELDNIKKNRILNKLNANSQIFLTTNDIKNIQPKLLTNSIIFEIKNGEIIKRKGEKYGKTNRTL